MVFMIFTVGVGVWIIGSFTINNKQNIFQKVELSKYTETSHRYIHTQNTSMVPHQIDKNLWHLDLLDGQIDGMYRYNATGKGVNIIIMDYFINSHTDYQERVKEIKTIIQCNLDQYFTRDLKILYHGTTITGTAIGKVFGIAKDATVYHYPLCIGSPIDHTMIDDDMFTDMMKKTEYFCTQKNKCILFLPFMSDPPLPVNHNILNLLNIIDKSQRFIIVMAAGNSNIRISRSTQIYTNLILVGAFEIKNFKTRYNELYLRKHPDSNFGSMIDVYAPGSEIITSGIKNQIVMSSGTSMGAAYVTGAIALLMEEIPNLITRDINNIIIDMPLVKTMYGDMRVWINQVKI